LDNSRNAIGWLNRSKLSSSEAEDDFGEHVLRAPSGALTFVNERRADHLGLPKGRPLGCARKGDACVRALADGCVTPNPAVNARSEHRALKIKRRFRSLVSKRF